MLAPEHFRLLTVPVLDHLAIPESRFAASADVSHLAPPGLSSLL
jgi:hypothetical protein